MVRIKLSSERMIPNVYKGADASRWARRCLQAVIEQVSKADLENIIPEEGGKLVKGEIWFLVGKPPACSSEIEIEGYVQGLLEITPPKILKLRK